MTFDFGMFVFTVGTAILRIFSVLKILAELFFLIAINSLTHNAFSLRAASRGDYVVPRTNRRFADRAFSTAVSWAWDQLPT